MCDGLAGFIAAIPCRRCVRILSRDFWNPNVAVCSNPRCPGTLEHGDSTRCPHCGSDEAVRCASLEVTIRICIDCERIIEIVMNE